MDSLQSNNSFLSFLLIASTVVVACYIARRVLFHSISNSSKKRRKNYPPVAGTVFHQLINFKHLAEYQTALTQKYRTFRMLTPTCNYVYTVDPANIEYILKTNFTNYGKGEFTHDTLKDLLGDGIFNVDGDKWRHQRKVASFEFSTKILRDYSSIVFRNTATKLAGIIADASSCNRMLDIQDLLMKSTLDSIFRVGFGIELDTLSGSNKDGVEFMEAFDCASCQVLHRFVDITWKVQRFFNIGAEAAMKSKIKLIDDFVYKLIDTKVEQMSQEKGEFAKKEDILSRFLLEKERDPENIDNKYLRDIILNFVIAGRDTTAATLSWFLYMLCKHPDIQEKVAQEVREATPMEKKVTSCEFSTSLTEEAINRMQYLHAAITETLRLYPAVPVDVKYCFSDDTLPDGFDVKKGDMVNYQPYPMGRMKFLWGDDAEEFKPERWFDSDGAFVPESPFKFTAFQAGPRICLGKEFAYRQMKIFAAMLLYFFRFELWDNNAMVKCKTMVTLQIDGGLHVRALQRS